MPTHLRRTALLTTTLVAALLTACGGGGGDSPAVTPPVSGSTTTVVVTPTNYTATTLCASGPALTSTVSQAAANALVPSACPALPASAYAATSVVVGSGTLTISVSGLPSGFTSGVLTATKFTPDISVVWDLIPTTTGNASATLRSGSSALGFATGYGGSILMNFAGDPSASKTITFTTSADPSVTLRDQAKAMIIPQGVQKVVPSVELASTCLRTTDTCFYQAVQNGTVLLIDTGVKRIGAPDANRDIIYGVYRQNGAHFIKPMHKDDLTGAFPNPPFPNSNYNETRIAMSSGGSFDRVQGSLNGMLVRAFNGSINANACYLSIWEAPSQLFGNVESNACPVWN